MVLNILSSNTSLVKSQPNSQPNLRRLGLANSEKLPGERRSMSIESTVVTAFEYGQARVRRFMAHCGASTLCVAGLYAILIILSECVGSIVEVLVFTLMGVIVNAGSLLKFVALAIMLVAYSYDCFNNVEKKYLKLNKALFSEVEWSLRLSQVTAIIMHLLVLVNFAVKS